MATFQKVKIGYQKKTLGEVVDFIDGDRGTNYPSEGEFFPNGECLFLNTKNVPHRKFSFEEKMFIDAKKDAVLRKGKLQRGDYVLTTRGTVGNFAYYDENVPYTNVRINSGMVILRKKTNELDEKFFRYYLSSTSFSGQVKSRVTGSAQPQLPIRDMLSMEIILPDPKTQTRIASVLSAYDDLIENNEKRIKALKGMAQLLYTEWFVKFKFPGHEKVKMVESETEYGLVPEGWEVKKLGEIADLIMGQSPTSNHYNLDKEGIPFHQGVADFGNQYPVDRVYSTAGNKYAEYGDLLFSVRAPVGRMNIANKKIILGRGLSAIRHKRGWQAFLYLMFANKFTEKDMIGNGAIYKSVNKIELENLQFIAPSDKVSEHFSSLVSPYFQKMEKITATNKVLSKTRDLLIPQLVTGRRKLK